MFELIPPELPKLKSGDEFQREADLVFRRTLLELAEDLQANSPVGVTGQLQDEWQMSIEGAMRFTVSNRAKGAFFRAVGRGPGKFPDFRPGTELAQWAIANSIPPFLVARAIAKRGTQRWRDRKNFAGIDRDGSFYAGGTCDRYTKQLARRLRAIRLQR